MKLMFKTDGGFRRIPDEELSAAIADGWVDGQAIWDAALDAKRAPVQTIAKVPEPDTLPAQPVKRAPGRPRNVVPSVLNDGEV